MQQAGNWAGGQSKQYYDIFQKSSQAAHDEETAQISASQLLNNQFDEGLADNTPNVGKTSAASNPAIPNDIMTLTKLLHSSEDVSDNFIDDTAQPQEKVNQQIQLNNQKLNAYEEIFKSFSVNNFDESQGSFNVYFKTKKGDEPQQQQIRYDEQYSRDSLNYEVKSGDQQAFKKSNVNSLPYNSERKLKDPEFDAIIEQPQTRSSTSEPVKENPQPSASDDTARQAFPAAQHSSATSATASPDVLVQHISSQASWKKVQYIKAQASALSKDPAAPRANQPKNQSKNQTNQSSMLEARDEKSQSTNRASLFQTQQPGGRARQQQPANVVTPRMHQSRISTQQLRQYEQRVIQATFQQLDDAVNTRAKTPDFYRQVKQTDKYEIISKSKTGSQPPQRARAGSGSNHLARSKQPNVVSSRKQRSFSVLNSAPHYYPTPQSDIYARQVQRKQLFERKLQRIRDDMQKDDECYSFTPQISYRGRNYVQNNKYRISRTLQEYLQEKRQRYSFTPRINKSRSTSSQVCRSPQCARPRHQQEEFSFQPTIYTNYRLKRSSSGVSAGERLYNERRPRDEGKSITIEQQCQNEQKLTRQQLEMFFSRQQQFLAQKQQIQQAILQAENAQCTFTPQINRSAQPRSIVARSPASRYQPTEYTFTPRINEYSEKINSIRKRQPIYQTSIDQWRQKQIQVRQNERRKQAEEYKQQKPSSQGEQLVQSNRFVIYGDKNW